MGWTQIDTVVERLRAGMGEDPAGTREQIAKLLEETRSPSGRVRLYALLIGACRRTGDLEAALRAYEIGREQRLRGRSRLARAELERHAAELHVVRNDREAARRAAERALCLIRPLARAPEGRSKGAKRKARLVRAMYAAALIARAQVAYHLEGDPRRALRDALEALRMADPRYAGGVHLSAVSAVALLATRTGSARDAVDVLRLTDGAEKLLRRRVPARHPHRVKLRGIRALAMVKLGATGDKAERMLLRVVRELRELGLDDDADRAAADLLWVVGERNGQHCRARYLRRALRLPAAMEPPEPTRLDPFDDDPIGF